MSRIKSRNDRRCGTPWWYVLALLLVTMVTCHACSAAPTSNRSRIQEDAAQIATSCDHQLGYALLTLVVTEKRTGKSMRRSDAICLPLNGDDVEIVSGSNVPFQMASNNTITTGSKSAGTNIHTSVMSAVAGTPRAIWLKLAYESSHVLQQADIPVRMTKLLPMIDSTRVNGAYLLQNNTARVLADWRRNDGVSDAWQVTARADWTDTSAPTLPLPEAATGVDIELLAGDDTANHEIVGIRGEIMPSDAFADRAQRKPTETEFFKGRQIPIETLVNNTSTWTYKDGGTLVHLTLNALHSCSLKLSSSRFVTFADVSDAPQLHEDTTTVAMTLRSDQIKTPMRLFGFSEPDRRTSFLLRRLVLKPIAVGK